MPFVSVIIPTFNRARWVRNAIDSVLGQSFSDFEVLVVDDGSTDDTAFVVKGINDGRVKYLFQRNGGVSVARNVGIENATGHWIAFLDSDDEWSPRYLDTHVQFIRTASSEHVMQATNCRVLSLEGGEESYFSLNNSIGVFTLHDHIVIERPFRFILQQSPWQLGSTIMLRSAALKSGLFDPTLSISEDLDLMARVSLLGSLGLIKEELVFIYRRAEVNVCLTSQSKGKPIDARETLERIYRKWACLPLTHEERCALCAAQGANRRAIGNMLLATGDAARARDSYRRAFQYDRSARSVGRYALSFFR